MAAKLNFSSVGSAGGSKTAASRITFVAFRDWIEGPGASTTVTTSPTHDDKMGQFDQLVLQTVTNRVTSGAGTVQLTVNIEHSADGVHWLPKSPVPAIDTPLSGNGPTYPPIAIDDGSTPSLGLVRLAITLSATSGPVRARVKITVTANDLHEKEFAREARAFLEAYDFSDYYYLCYTSDQLLSPTDFNYGQLKAAVFAGILPLDLLYHPVKLFKGWTCCFRQNRDFIIVKDGKVIYASNPPAPVGGSFKPTPKDGPSVAPPKTPSDGEPISPSQTVEWHPLRHVDE